MAENPLSNCSSATSVGDSEPGLKRTISTSPNTSGGPHLTTPVKPIINLIPAEEPTISKRSRFNEDIANSPSIHKRANPLNLAPPAAERPSILFSALDPLPLTSTPTLAPATLPPSTTQLVPTPINLFQNTMGTSNSTTLPATSYVSSCFGLKGPQNTTTNFQGFGGNTQGIMKLSDKQAQIFGNVRQAAVGSYKSESEKEKILFEYDRNLVQAEKSDVLEMASKDPHGLNWLNLGEKKSDPGLGYKKLNPKFEKNMLRKRVEDKNPFELVMPRKLTFCVFNSKRTIQTVVNEPVFTIDDSFTCKIGLSSQTKNYKFHETLPKQPAKIQIPLKQGYTLTPSINFLTSQTQSELQSIYPLSIQNDHGIITFTKPVNLHCINFHQDLSINKGSISVYQNSTLPDPGEGFNTSAQITLFACKPLKPVPTGDFIDILRSLCTHFNSKFISWNPETGDWKFFVNNFEAFY